ncbi:uncharacterized protein LOC143252948 [Tachypleus tridentatus]|uniref:uncharacterized protein LOC143252948 n=1 Tax=Tachypleus tridentatus TaxID=6853 RepID=UPI003FD11B46
MTKELNTIQVNGTTDDNIKENAEDRTSEFGGETKIQMSGKEVFSLLSQLSCSEGLFHKSLSGGGDGNAVTTNTKPYHRDAMEASKLSTAMTKATVSATNKSETAIIAAMHNVYFAAKHDLPSFLIPHLNRLCMMQGATQLQHLVVDQHTTYEHNNSISDF